MQEIVREGSASVGPKNLFLEAPKGVDTRLDRETNLAVQIVEHSSTYGGSINRDPYMYPVCNNPYNTATLGNLHVPSWLGKLQPRLNGNQRQVNERHRYTIR